MIFFVCLSKPLLKEAACVLVRTLAQIFGECSFSSVCLILIGARNVAMQLQMITEHQQIFREYVVKKNPPCLGW